MAKIGKKLGKLSLAILENLVEGKLGKKFVDELRAPTDRAIAINNALENSEKRFKKEFDDAVFVENMFVQVSAQSIGLLSEVVEKFYDHPTDLIFPDALAHILSDSFPYVDKNRINRAVYHYVRILTEELALADSTFRESVRTLADLRGEQRQQEMVDVLRKMEALLVVHETPTVVPPVVRVLHQLPQPPADFIGRKELIRLLLKDFKKGRGVTITGQHIHGLTGMGGIGKTALGLIVGHQVAKGFPDAQIFLDLKGTTTPLTASDIIRHVILSFEPTMDLRALDQDALFTTYQSILHGKKVLLFLDNARSAEQIVPLLPPKNCAMLVTSRRTFSVPGLNVCRVDVMSEEDAMDFLLELCPRIGSRAADLTKACAYLPLALRIAGSFLQVNGDWSIEEYLSRLGDRKRRLITLQVSHKEAELTTEPDLLASFDVSYNQLSGEYRKCWRVLGVFPASFDVSAASAVWKFEEAETKKLLSLLLRYSLLDYDPTSFRYSLHDLLADYTLSQMDSEENGEARLRHASHYKDVLNTAKALYKQGGENIMVGLRLFDLEWHNIRAGQAWAASEAETSRAAAELCFEYPYSGAYVLQLRQHPREQMQWLEIAVSAAHQVGNRPGEMKALGNLGVAYVSLGELSKAIVFFEQVLSIAREIGDRVGEVSALGNLGTVYAGMENVTKAIEFFEQVLVITRELGDRHGEAMTLGNLGSAYGDLGNARKAIEFYEQALLIDRETGDRDGEAENLGNLGIVYSRLGEVHKAIENYESQLVIVREIGDRGGEGNALLNMGQALYELDEKDQAVHLVKQALDFFEAIESPSIEEAREKLKEWGALRGDDTD